MIITPKSASLYIVNESNNIMSTITNNDFSWPRLGLPTTITQGETPFNYSIACKI